MGAKLDWLKRPSGALSSRLAGGVSGVISVTKATSLRPARNIDSIKTRPRPAVLMWRPDRPESDRLTIGRLIPCFLWYEILATLALLRGSDPYLAAGLRDDFRNAGFEILVGRPDSPQSLGRMDQDGVLGRMIRRASQTAIEMNIHLAHHSDGTRLVAAAIWTEALSRTNALIIPEDCLFHRAYEELTRAVASAPRNQDALRAVAKSAGKRAVEIHAIATKAGFYEGVDLNYGAV